MNQFERINTNTVYEEMKTNQSIEVETKKLNTTHHHHHHHHRFRYEILKYQNNNNKQRKLLNTTPIYEREIDERTHAIHYIEKLIIIIIILHLCS